MSQGGYGSISTYQNDDIVAVRNSQVNVNVEVGRPRETGTRTYIKSTYAARYNFGVDQYKTINDDYSNRKRNMFGGLVLLNLIAAVMLFGLSLSFCIYAATISKALIAVPFIIAAIYLTITVYNWFIFFKNGSLVHELMFQVPDHHLPDTINKHFTIPLNANIQNREFIAATDGSTTAMISRLRQQYVNLTEIDIMLFDSNYRKHISFPKESILHCICFIFVIAFAINRLNSMST